MDKSNGLKYLQKLMAVCTNRREEIQAGFQEGRNYRIRKNR